MSSASKSKSKDKKAGKDPQKVSQKPSGLANMASGAPLSGYNPLLGKFHTIETAPLSSSVSSLQVNGRFQNIDETDEHSGSSGVGNGECDTLSNNGSWSGESEDLKDKTLSLVRQETIMPGTDSDKREKIRQKNERKHQRQKERRALELHERCNGFLMSRKLEALALQLVGMGFSQERATMALISNEGKMEESVAWLLEGGEEASDEKRKGHHNLDCGNLKIDISDELARIADMEIRYKCSRQEVERAIVTCEGDLEKAADTLRLQKQDLPSSLSKPGETGEFLMGNEKLPLPSGHNLLRIQPKSMPAPVPQQRRDDKDFNYTKTVGPNGVITIEPVSNKNVQVLRKQSLSKPEWTAKPQQILTSVDKRLAAAAANPAVSYPLPSPVQAAPVAAKTEARYTALGSEIKNLQLGSVKEPVIVMQRPQSINAKQAASAAILSSSPPNAAGWYPNNSEFSKPNGLANGLPFHIPSTRSLESHNNNLSSSSQMYNQLQQQQQQQQQYQPPQYVSYNSLVDSRGPSRESGLWNRVNSSSPTLAVASSLGLFAGFNPNGSPASFSHVDWKTGGSAMQIDLANIDWSLDPNSRPSSGGTRMAKNVNGYGVFSLGVDARSAMGSSAMANSGGGGGGLMGLQGGGGGLMGLQGGGGGGGRVVASSSGETSAAGARVWASPFEEKDLFSLPRQFVSSPSL